MHYFPLAWPFIATLAVLTLLVIILIQLRILQYAYERAGIDRRYVFAVLLLSLLGSSINLPIAELGQEPVVSGRVVEFYGVQYIVPVVEQWPRTIIAVNVGGAVIPTLVSIYLLFRQSLFVPAIVGTAIVSVVVHRLAVPQPGVGITVPVFIPPLAAALTALLLSRHRAPSLAYIIGSMGVLIGADLMNWSNFEGLGAPVASIGGAGTFDGIFVTGILAVLLAPAAGIYDDDEPLPRNDSHASTG
jgi:uncharacterized membrane protein